jgi:hypothetical protein
MGGLLCCCARIAWFQSMELVHANNCATVFKKSTGERSDLNVCVLTRLAFLQKLGIKEPSKYRFSGEVLDLTSLWEPAATPEPMRNPLHWCGSATKFYGRFSQLRLRFLAWG